MALTEIQPRQFGRKGTAFWGRRHFEGPSATIATDIAAAGLTRGASFPDYPLTTGLHSPLLDDIEGELNFGDDTDKTTRFSALYRSFTGGALYRTQGRLIPSYSLDWVHPTKAGNHQIGTPQQVGNDLIRYVAVSDEAGYDATVPRLTTRYHIEDLGLVLDATLQAQIQGTVGRTNGTSWQGFPAGTMMMIGPIIGDIQGVQGVSRIQFWFEYNRDTFADTLKLQKQIWVPRKFKVKKIDGTTDDESGQAIINGVFTNTADAPETATILDTSGFGWLDSYII